MSKKDLKVMALHIVDTYYSGHNFRKIEDFTDNYVETYKKVLENLNEEFSSGGIDFLK